MAWFNVDDSFYDHPKVWDAPDCAVSLWARAGSWSSRNLTDGFVPTGMPARFCGDPETAVRELVDRGLWQRTKGGYLFHDWTDWNSSKEAVKAKRTANARRQALFRDPVLKQAVRERDQTRAGTAPPWSAGGAAGHPRAAPTITSTRPARTPTTTSSSHACPATPAKADGPRSRPG